MKKLELNQMENLEGGGSNQRNCGVMGLVIGVSAIFCWTGVGAGICAGAILTAANSDCF
jgi:hypothetical protein